MCVCVCEKEKIICCSNRASSETTKYLRVPTFYFPHVSLTPLARYIRTYVSHSLQKERKRIDPRRQTSRSFLFSLQSSFFFSSALSRASSHDLPATNRSLARSVCLSVASVKFPQCMQRHERCLGAKSAVRERESVCVCAPCRESSGAKWRCRAMDKGLVSFVFVGG